MDVSICLEDPVTVPTGHRLGDGRGLWLCPPFVRLREEQRGPCFVRDRVADRMVLTAYRRRRRLQVSVHGSGRA